MDLSFRTEEHRKIDKIRVAAFCERYADILAKASPEEIIVKWLDFQFARYQVHEDSTGFYINDYEEKEMVAFVSKQDPRAFAHAYELCEKLNEPSEKPFISMNGRELIPIEANTLVELKDNDIVDFLIDNIEKDKHK